MDKVIAKYRKLINESANKYEMLECLYREYKMRSVDFFDGNFFDENYEHYLDQLESIEEKMPIDYIIDTNIATIERPTLASNRGFLKRKQLNNREIEDVLDYLVYCGRASLAPHQNIKNYDAYDASNDCFEGTKYIADMATKCRLKHHIVSIDPGFSYGNSLLEGSGYHYFNIITYKDRNFLVDITYKQFFKKNECSLERLGLPLWLPPLAGIYMVKDDLRRCVAETLLKNGWIELTPEVVKAYFDGFAISYRNGLYYEDRDIVFETDYTYQDYINFLRGCDNQVNHEGREVLGFQLRPLKYPSMRFKK